MGSSHYTCLTTSINGGRGNVAWEGQRHHHYDYGIADDAQFGYKTLGSLRLLRLVMLLFLLNMGFSYEI